MVELDWRFLHSLNTVQSNRGTAGALQHACQADPVAIRSLALAIAIGYGPPSKARIMLEFVKPESVRPQDAEVEAAASEIRGRFDAIGRRTNSGRYFTTTLILITRLRDNGYSLPAAEWAIYELLRKEHLSLDDGHVEAHASGNVIDGFVRKFDTLVDRPFAYVRTLLGESRTETPPKVWHRSRLYSTPQLWTNERTTLQPSGDAENGENPTDDMAKLKPGRKIPRGKILLGQSLQFDWLTYKAQGNPDDENEAYDEWRIDEGKSGDFELSLAEAKQWRNWFAHTHIRRHGLDNVSLEQEFTLSDDDKAAIADWLKSRLKGTK